jgi:hypothetical protein
MKRVTLIVVIAFVMCSASQACAGGLGKLLFAIVQGAGKAAVTSAPTAAKAAVKTVPTATKVTATAVPVARKAAVQNAPASNSNFVPDMAAVMLYQQMNRDRDKRNANR